MANNKKFDMKPHAIGRLYNRERVSIPTSVDTVLLALQNNKFVTVKKSTNTRNLLYGVVNGCPMKIIYSKRTKKIITFLPIQYPYCLKWKEYEFNNKKYRIKIYPDCYLETDDSRMLTKFEVFDPIEGVWKPKKKSENVFGVIFLYAWNEYQDSLGSGGFIDEIEIEEEIGTNLKKRRN